MSIRFDILPKLSLCFLLIVSSFVLSWEINALLFAGISLLGFFLFYSQVSPQETRKRYQRFLLYVLGLTVLIAVTNGLFLREGISLDGFIGITFYQGGLEFGAKTAFRLAVLSITLFLFFVTTPIRELVHFFQRAGFPSALVAILFLTLHFLAQLPLRVNQIFTAQEARGAPVRGGVFSRIKAFFLVLFPLTLSSISETLERGAALELRGFRGELVARKERSFSTSSLVLASLFMLTAFLLIILSFAR